MLAEAKPELNRLQIRLGASRADGLDALESAVGRLWEKYEKKFYECSRERPAGGMAWRLDHAARLNRDEYMDRPDFPEEEREREISLLHKMNERFGTYRRAFESLRPFLDEAVSRTRRTPRLMDLASGYGGFPLAMARFAKQENFPLETSGSDIQEGHVKRAQERARQERLPVSFRIVNGFQMEGLNPGEYDVFTMLQAVHHFRPGQIARMIAESLRLATTGFVAIDAVRAPWLPLVMGLPSFLITRSYHFAHDAFVSGCKMYDAAELEFIARAAAPDAEVRCHVEFPYNVLEVRRPLSKN
ncbi:MAG: methyltransferase domain-containing protein [Bdellovibrionota bacterium]